MDLFVGTRKSENQFIITDKEYHHCVRVTRHKTGDIILVTDFSGIIYLQVLCFGYFISGESTGENAERKFVGKFLILVDQRAIIF